VCSLQLPLARAAKRAEVVVQFPIFSLQQKEVEKEQQQRRTTTTTKAAAATTIATTYANKLA